MRYRIYRHLRGVPPADISAEPTKRPEMTWKDHLVMLLHIGAEIEHSLMVQYLYAAYSLGGEQVPVRHRNMVRRWQASILAVAKEEMGHFLTAQNILTLIGAPINLNREDLPWDVPFYPFRFTLEPLTMESVACYVFAEMPPESELVDADDKKSATTLSKRYRTFLKRDLPNIKRLVKRRTLPNSKPHRVGNLYDEIIELIADRKRIPDSVFQELTFAVQASSDDWGRGYQPDPRLVDAGGSLTPSNKPAPDKHLPNVMIDRIATRAEAIVALRALAMQGEAPLLGGRKTEELSHFDRFLEIYHDFEKIEGNGRTKGKGKAAAKPWKPARRVPTNPTTLNDPPNPDGYIAAVQSREWASLFNLRYRLLLRYLAHTFRLARVTRPDTPNLRAMVMHRVFGEMYNLKTIAGILIRSPLSDPAPGARVAADAPCAGPPFEMPYTLNLSVVEPDIWIFHRDLLGSSQRICKTLLSHPDAKDRDYLTTLFELDSQARKWIDQILAGLAPTERNFQ
jgi:hypothetical protein